MLFSLQSNNISIGGGHDQPHGTNMLPKVSCRIQLLKHACTLIYLPGMKASIILDKLIEDSGMISRALRSLGAPNRLLNVPFLKKLGKYLNIELLFVIIIPSNE